MKNLLILFSTVILIVTSSSALPPIGKKEKKEEDKKEESIVEENNDEAKSKIVVEPYKSIGITSVDNLGYDSYRLAKATDSLQKEANFLQVTTEEKQDPNLGVVTETVCKDGSGNVISCQGLNKEEALKKFESILVALGQVSTSIPPLVATIPQIQSEVTSMKSNPTKAVKAAKGLSSLVDIGKSLSSTGANTSALISNINMSIKNLKLIKGQ
jgi:hypothetical protein